MCLLKAPHPPLFMSLSLFAQFLLSLPYAPPQQTSFSVRAKSLYSSAQGPDHLSASEFTVQLPAAADTGPVVPLCAIWRARRGQEGVVPSAELLAVKKFVGDEKKGKCFNSDAN